MTKTKSGPVTGDNRNKVARFADRLVKLADDYRDDIADVVEDIKKAELDVSAVKRLAAWSRKDPVKRAEQEAIDHQYRFLAGDVETPAALPAEGPLAEAAKLYRDKLSVRQVAGVLKVSTGRAQQLRTLAALFTVHVHEDVNTPHDPETGEILVAEPQEMAPEARREGQDGSPDAGQRGDSTTGGTGSATGAVTAAALQWGREAMGEVDLSASRRPAREWLDEIRDSAADPVGKAIERALVTTTDISVAAVRAPGQTVEILAESANKPSPAGLEERTSSFASTPNPDEDKLEYPVFLDRRVAR